jgi:hypothetical protein
MNARMLTKLSLFVAAVLGPSAVLACGEMMFNAGKGLPFQSYIAPRPADVLILHSAANDDAYYEALERAGHHLTLVLDPSDLEYELEQHDYDIVIADYDAIEAVPASLASNSAARPRLLPIVARSARKSPQVRERFKQILLEGASLGQVLTMINRVVASTA